MMCKYVYYVEQGDFPKLLFFLCCRCGLPDVGSCHTSPNSSQVGSSHHPEVMLDNDEQTYTLENTP